MELWTFPLQIKSHIWVFVNCLIENPTFDSQTKENMTLQPKNFGSKCLLTQQFMNQVRKRISSKDCLFVCFVCVCVFFLFYGKKIFLKYLTSLLKKRPASIAEGKVWHSPHLTLDHPMQVKESQHKWYIGWKSSERNFIFKPVSDFSSVCQMRDHWRDFDLDEI